ncbi:MAG: ABC transporter permease [Planctomycetaceae bacterium]|nr:ABC transporter permease [Planctomycetaceae bacterium]
MVLEKPILPIFEWLSLNLPTFLATVLAVILLGMFIGFLAGALRHGPVESLRILTATVTSAIRDLIQLSPRRMFAIARLAFQESIRRRVLVVFAVFVIALLFAGWFLDPSSSHPARLYLSFVLTSSNYLVLILAVFLSAFSLPTDIKNRTIYTIVTKPVRPWEIVVGRMLGFCAVGTVILALMCVFSFFFVKRGLQHTHQVNPQQLASETVDANGETLNQQIGESSLARAHRHEVIVNDAGEMLVTPNHDHFHRLTQAANESRDGQYQLGAAEGSLQARVPIRGSLRFIDSTGKPSVGTNVGYENKYRKYVEGGTLAAAIWTFEGLKAEDFPNGLPLEMTLRVFRTFKGEIEQGLTGTIQLVKPTAIGPDGQPSAASEGWKSDEFSFTARDYDAYERFIPRKIDARDDQGNEVTVDIFESLVNSETDSLEIWIRCLDQGQYLGMAAADLYLRASNKPFWLNFLKGYISIWFQMVVVTCFGVMFSTVVSGAVAMMATLAAVVMGLFKGFVVNVASGEMPGGGPLESLVRLVKQTGQMVELDQTVGTTIIQRIDDVLMFVIQTVSYAMPDCSIFNTSRFVAYGFNIPAALMAQHFVITLAYVAVASAVGYFCFRTREIAA